MIPRRDQVDVGHLRELGDPIGEPSEMLLFTELEPGPLGQLHPQGAAGVDHEDARTRHGLSCHTALSACRKALQEVLRAVAVDRLSG